MAKTRYSSIAEYYFDLVLRHPDFDSVKGQADPQRWHDAATVLQSLPFDEWRQIRSIVDRKHRTARITEDVLNPVIGKRTHDHRSAGHLIGIVFLILAHGSLRVPAWARRDRLFVWA